MSMNGSDEVIDAFARERVEVAYDMARKAWEYNGEVMREVESMRRDMKTEFGLLHMKLDGAKLPQKSAASLPPLSSVDKVSDTGTHIILTVEEAQKRDLETQRAIERYEQMKKAQRWDTMLSGGWKLALLVAGAVVLAGLSLLGGALLQQAAQHPPTLNAPHGP